MKVRKFRFLKIKKIEEKRNEGLIFLYLCACLEQIFANMPRNC